MSALVDLIRASLKIYNELVVFQGQHPGIALKPIHMSKRVEQMYLHVVGRSYTEV